MQRTKTTKVFGLRSYTSFSLFILDIDYFKQINDHYGHNCDDEVLLLSCPTVCLLFCLAFNRHHRHRHCCRHHRCRHHRCRHCCCHHRCHHCRCHHCRHHPFVVALVGAVLV